MAEPNSPRDLTEALSAPLGDLIAAIGRGVADAQGALDAQTVETIKRMYGGGDELLDTLRRLGYQPTWYRIPEVESEMVMSLSISGESLEEAGTGTAGAGQLKLYAAPIDATFQNKYEFDLQAASRVKFKIVPVPPSSQASLVKAVPDLAGKTYGEVRGLLEELGIAWKYESVQEPSDSETITEHTPAAGSLLGPGEVVLLETESEES